MARTSTTYREQPSAADSFMYRLLRVQPRTASGRSAERAFSTSIAISTVRCLLTYVILPLLAPVVGLSGRAGPVLGLVLGVVSVTAIVVSMRRFWASTHRWRWAYTIVGGGIIVLLVVGAIMDVAALV